MQIILLQCRNPECYGLTSLPLTVKTRVGLALYCPYCNKLIKYANPVEKKMFG